MLPSIAEVMQALHVPDELCASLRARIEACIVSLHGWTSVDKGLRLAELVVIARASLSVELGVFGGRGTIAMAIGHEALGRGCVVAVDPWERAASLEGTNAPENDAWWGGIDHEAIYQGFLKALTDCRVDSFCRVMRQRSAVAAEEFAAGSITVLHQDSNHSEAVSTAEVELWTPKLREGGYWVADDTDWATTAQAQRLLVEKRFAIVEEHPNWKVFRKET
jgi:hypothetical protein